MTQRLFIPQSFQVPNWLIDDLACVLEPSDLVLLVFLCRKTFGWGKDFDTISLSQLERYTGLTRRTVIRRVKILQAAGLLIVQREGSVNAYGVPRVIEDIESIIEKLGGDLKSLATDPSLVTPTTPASVTEAPAASDTSTLTKLNINPLIQNALEESLFDDITEQSISKYEDELIEKIIALYPVKRRAARGGRDSLRKALRRDRKQCEGVNVLEKTRAAAVVIYQGTRSFAQTWAREKTDPQFIPLATTFFNQERYRPDTSEVVTAISDVSTETSGESRSIREVRALWDEARKNRKPISDRVRKLFSGEAS